MIRTTYADTELVREDLPTVRGQPDEDRLLRAAAILDNLGITVTDTQGEANEDSWLAQKPSAGFNVL